MGKRKRLDSMVSQQPPLGAVSQNPPDEDVAAVNKNKTAVLNEPAKPFAANPVGEDRIREAYLYEYLGSEIAEFRTKAAVTVVCSLEDVTEEVFTRHLDHRLLRGLASPRNASRLGYSLVLTELLRQLFGERNRMHSYPRLSFDRVLDLLVGKTSAKDDACYERDLYLGRLFGLQAFVEARILFDDKARWGRVLELLLQLSNKKGWLRSQCGFVIVNALRYMGEAFVEVTLSRILKAGMEWTPEGIAIKLVALDRFPEQAWKNPLASKSLESLANALNEKKPQESEDAGVKKTNWTHQLHFVWDVLLDHYLKLARKLDKHGWQFELFWGKVVDGESLLLPFIVFFFLFFCFFLCVFACACAFDH